MTRDSVKNPTEALPLNQKKNNDSRTIQGEKGCEIFKERCGFRVSKVGGRNRERELERRN